MSAVVIVGASHAGVQAAASLRQFGWEGGIILLSAETDPPYHRPPLSKAYLARQKDAEQLLLRAPDFYRSQGIDLCLGEPALAIDPKARQVTTAVRCIGYNKLILATGSKARNLHLPGHDAEGIHTLRSIANARALRTALEKARNIVIIGGGFIGLEVAATAAAAGKSASLLEAQSRLLSRALPATLGGFLARQHGERGVDIRFQAMPERYDVADGQIIGVTLKDGTRLPADLVLVGIGGIADMALTDPLGLKVQAGGIAVDEHARTNLPDVYAVGDVAAFQNICTTDPMRLESVQNAVDQAKAAAAHITGGHAPLTATPWFWTDQYDMKMQMAGLSRPGVVDIMRGTPGDGGFSIAQMAEDRLVALYSVNRAADHMASRRLIASGQRLDPARVADIETPLMKTIAGVS